MHYFLAGLASHGAVREHEAMGHEPPHPLLGASVEKMLHGKAVGHEPPHPLLGALTKKQSAVSAQRCFSVGMETDHFAQAMLGESIPR